MKTSVVWLSTCLLGGCFMMDSRRVIDPEILKSKQDELVAWFHRRYNNIEKMSFKSIKPFSATGSWDIKVVINDTESVTVTMMNWDKLEFYTVTSPNSSLTYRDDEESDTAKNDTHHIHVDYVDEVTYD